MRVAVWGPLPPTPTALAQHGAELLPALARHFDVVAVVEDPQVISVVAGASVASARTPPEADLHLYQIANSPDALFSYRRARERPGVVILHEYVFHDLVVREAMDRQGVGAYLREMRREHGEAGVFVGRQFALGRAGALLPVLYPVNDGLVETSLGVVTLTRTMAESLQRRHPAVPFRYVPRHVPLVGSSPPARASARRALGLAHDARVVTAVEGRHARAQTQLLEWAIGHLHDRLPVRLLATEGTRCGRSRSSGEPDWADSGAVDARIRDRLLAADVVACLGFPSHGEMPAGLLLAMALGRPVLVTAGTPGADEMPEGTVVPLDPGLLEEEELVAFLRLLLGNPGLREDIGCLARAHVEDCHSIDAVVAALTPFLEDVYARREKLLARAEDNRPDEETLKGDLVEEVRGAVRDLGLPRALLGIETVLAELAGPRTIPKV